MSRAGASQGPTRAGAPAENVVTEPSPLRNTRFRVFAAGNLVNNIGESVYATALPLLAYRLTGALSVMSLLAAAVPIAMLLAPSLGTVADRWGSRVLVVPGLLLQAAAALGMNVLLLAGVDSTAALFCCALLVAVGAAAYRTGWMTGVPGMFPEFPVRARGMLNSGFFATTLIGPLVVTASLTFIGYTGLLWLNLATFFAPILVWALGVHPPRAARQSGSGTQWKMSEGWRAVTQDRRLSEMLVVQVVLNIACGAGLNSLLVFALGRSWHLSGDAVGLALTVMNACMLVGNLLVAQRTRLRPWTALALGMTARAGSLLLLAVAPSFPVFLIAMAVGALGQGAVLSTVVMMRVKYLPGAVLGRASGLMWLITGAASLLSPVLTPLFDRLAGSSLTFLLLGIATCGAVGHLCRSRAHWAEKPTSTTV